MRLLEVLIGILALLLGIFLLVTPLMLVFILMLTRTQMDRQWEGYYVAGSVFCCIMGLIIIIISLVWTRSSFRRAHDAAALQKTEPKPN